MARRTIDMVDIRITRDEQLNAVLQRIADMYKNPYRIIYEYIQNSIDSANALRENYNKTDFPYPIEIKININTKSKEIYILDDCEGMDIDLLHGLAISIFESRKKNLPWAAGQFGYGIHSFRSFFKKITFRTKVKGGCLLEISFQKNRIKGNPIDEITEGDDDFPYESGTLVILSGFDQRKSKFKQITSERLKQDIELHFENILREPDFNIALLEDNSNKVVCEPFDYNSIDGVEMYNEIPIKVDGETKNLSVNLKVVETPQKDRFPKFTCKNIRINEIAFCSSFQRVSKNILLWEHPRLIGYVEVNDIIDPELERSDFPVSPERDLVYEELTKLEPEIREEIDKITESANIVKFYGLGGMLSNIFSRIAKDDDLFFREAYRRASSAGEEPDIFLAGLGGAELEGEGGPGEGVGGIGGTESIGIGEGEGLGEDGTGPEIGSGEEGIGTEKSEEGAPAKKRKRPGFTIEFDDWGEDAPPANIIEDVIWINTGHPHFEERVSWRGDKLDIKSGRLVSYLAQLITTFYIQKRFQKYKITPEVNNQLFFDFTDIVCRADSLLYLYRKEIEKIIKSKTLKDFENE